MKIVQIQPRQTTGGIRQAMGFLELMLEEDFQIESMPVTELREPPEPPFKNSAPSSDIQKHIENANLVYFHGAWQFDFWQLARYCKKHGIPYLAAPHGMLEPWCLRSKAWKKWPYFHLIEKNFLSAAQAIVAVSEMEKSNLQRLLPQQTIHTLPLGIQQKDKGPAYQQAREQLNIPAQTFHLLYLGRLDPKKGLHILLHALCQLPHSLKTQCRLTIVGSGDSTYERKLKKIAHQHKGDLPSLTWQQALWGDEKWAYLQSADLFCLPSYSENFGMAVLEALQVGTPVLTSPYTPWAKEFHHPSHSICTPTASAISSCLQNALTRSRLRDSEREELSQWAHQNFSAQELRQKYLSATAQVLGG